MADQPTNQVNVVIVKFYSKAKEEIVKVPKMVPVADGKGGLAMVEVMDYQKTGKMIPEDWVLVAPPGQLDRQVTPHKIADIQKIKGTGAENHPASDSMVHFRDFILRHYDMWKKGEEVPLEGTPLVAWNALSTEEVDAFKKAGIRTVEEIRDMNDTLLGKVQVARPREKKALAKRFLEAADQNRASAELARRDAEMEALKAQIADLQKSMAAQPPKKTLSMPKHEAAA